MYDAAKGFYFIANLELDFIIIKCENHKNHKNRKYVIITQAFIKKLTDSGDLAPRRVLRGPLVSSMAACCTRAGLRGVQAYLQCHHKITYYILQTLYFITKTFVQESPLPAKRGVFD